jgi:hypothetical protein
MPVRSSSSSVLVWPTRAQVGSALETWAAANAAARPDLLRLGYFGSFAGTTWGVGSDLDLVAVVRHSALPFARRAIDWDLAPLPVPADLLVYTESEWLTLMASGGRFGRTLAREIVWIVGRA